jgi:hypothetical protein
MQKIFFFFKIFFTFLPKEIFHPIALIKKGDLNHRDLYNLKKGNFRAKKKLIWSLRVPGKVAASG